MEKVKAYRICLINELYDLSKSDNVKINNSLMLRKGNNIDISYFNNYIEIFKSKFWTNYFENELHPSKDGLNPDYVKLNKTKRRYTILENQNFQLDEINRISLKISDLRITPILELSIEYDEQYDDSDLILTKDEFLSYNILIDTLSTYIKYGTKKFVREKPSELLIADFNKTLNFVKSILKQENNEFGFIAKALRDFTYIDIISNKTPFKLLSYFSILESLITYQPSNNSDTIISKQLSKKTKFLYNNFVDDFDFKNYFKGSNTNTIETIISKLYIYRNDIAHGNIPKLEKELKIINDNIEYIIPFISELVRKILKIAIEKPKLIVDLKEC